MKFVIDEIIDDIAKLENILNGNVIYVNINLLPSNIKESDVVIFKNNKYIKDEKEKENRFQRIKAKMERLNNNKDF